MIITLVAVLSSIFSMVVAGALIGLLAAQQVYAHIRSVKRLFIVTFATFLGINMILLVRRIFPFDELTAITAFRLLYSLMLISATTIGVAAITVYRKPKDSVWKDVYAELATGEKTPLPFASYMSLLFIIFIFVWVIPMHVELRSCPAAYTTLYAPVVEMPRLIIAIISFTIFLSYPAVIFVLASYAVEHVTVSRNLRMFAICVIALGASDLIQVFLLTLCFAEAACIIRIPIFIILAYLFRRMTALQSFQEVELGEYLAHLRRRRKQ